MKKTLLIILGSLQIFVGLTAFISGILLVIYPSGKLLNAPLEMLNGSPFNDFLLPGLILLSVNGIGQLIAGYLTFRKNSYSSLIAAVLGIGLMIWIFVQVNMIGGGHLLQYSYFFIGVAETSLAFLICYTGTNKIKFNNIGNS